jgi:hypothetical protein
MRSSEIAASITPSSRRFIASSAGEAGAATAAATVGAGAAEREPQPNAPTARAHERKTSLQRVMAVYLKTRRPIVNARMRANPNHEAAAARESDFRLKVVIVKPMGERAFVGDWPNAPSARPPRGT